MPSQYEIDTRFIELLFKVCLILIIFSFVFLATICLVGNQSKFLQISYILFLMLFILLLGMVFAIFVKWFIKYKNSLIRFR